jgi:magnesium transporter
MRTTRFYTLFVYYSETLNRILDDITDKYTPLIRSVELEVESIDELVFVISGYEQSDMLRRIASARKRVTILQKLLVAKADVLRMIAKRLEAIASTADPPTTPANHNISTAEPRLSTASPTAMGGTSGTSGTSSGIGNAAAKDTVLYLSDVQDHVITMVQSLSHADNTLNRSHSNYLAQINIEITQSSNKANDAMTKLTAIASILVPLNVVTGLWGMNVRVPGMIGFGDDDPHYSWFIGIIVAMITISASAFIFVRRSGLVGKLAT